jgi:hypothetical protein
MHVEVVEHEHHRFVLDAEIEPVHLRAPDALRHALEEEGQADGGHEQRDRRLVDQRRSTTFSVAMPSTTIDDSASMKRQPEHGSPASPVQPSTSVKPTRSARRRTPSRPARS